MPRTCAICGIVVESDVHVCPADGSSTAVLADDRDLTGQVVEGRFLVEELLGKGGMGAVYRARQFSVDRDVAIKVLRARVGEGAKARFFREARAASRLANPHAVTVFDFGQTGDGLLFIVMELVKGRPLSEVIEEQGGPMEWRRAAGIMLQVMDALVEAHDSGVVHRDLKPDNLLLLENDLHEDFVKVMDFGLATVAEMGAPRVTEAGVIMGTPEYMAPEQAQGLETDARSDIYSAGVVLFELLSGRLPFESCSGIRQLAEKVGRPAPRLTEAMPGLSVPSAVAGMIDSMLERDPGARPGSAREVRHCLSTALSNDDRPDPRQTIEIIKAAGCGEEVLPAPRADNLHRDVSARPWRFPLAVAAVSAAALTCAVVALVIIAAGTRPEAEEPASLASPDATAAEADDVAAVEAFTTATVAGIDAPESSRMAGTPPDTDRGARVTRTGAKDHGLLRVLRRREGGAVTDDGLPLRRRER